jgi:hypothetical protein
MELLRVLAHGRHFVKDQANPNRKKVMWNNTQEAIDLLGVMGEYAVSKHLKIPMDMSVSLEGDGGIDMYYGQYNLQIKTTKYKTGRLVFNMNQPIDADIYILCYAIEQESLVHIQGYIRQAHIPEQLVVMNLGHGMRKVIEQRCLSPISMLTAAI